MRQLIIVVIMVYLKDSTSKSDNHVKNSKPTGFFSLTKDLCDLNNVYSTGQLQHQQQQHEILVSGATLYRQRFLLYQL